ncbi:hypothetical protein EUA93_18885 [Nocardioides oleivorans]|uniref:Uncharacterized protein n=1 Tax=Nocardioides oleivorans TaxID=273676 RepID=A0A4V1RK45_9ACTN|nr:hypothetical protein [Nocardioides oleivorans]RYB91002.1 hypothetical protein EUA93_18885 [Nocardioides oleivorans]
MFTARDDIAAAATGSLDVTIYPEYRQTLQAYTGFVKWNGRARDDSGLGWIDTWQVWFALPQDVRTAEQWLADRLDDLLGAISTELVITNVVPADLVLGGGGSTNGLIIEGARAA